MSDGFLESFVSSGEDGTALSNTTTPTSIIPVARKITLPSGYFSRVGRQLIIRAGGRISTAAATPGTLTFSVRLGSTTVFDGGASGTLALSASNLTWLLELVLTCRALGSSATLLGIGRLHTAALSATVPQMLLPASAPAAGTAFDSTSSHTLDLFAAWSAASASNSITCHQFNVKSGV
jgi:hypothetical protein